MPATLTLKNIIRNNSEEKFLKLFENALSQENHQILEAHRTILRACYSNPELCPTIKGEKEEEVVRRWIKRYDNGYKNRISKRISRPPKTTSDPIISDIIGARMPGLTEEHLEQIKYAHRLSMSAENILGLLLEEFLAEQLAEYGWHCCWGATLLHVDFCNVDGRLLQVKNRSNSENSSSSKLRNKKNIKIWYRIDAESGSYKWDDFNSEYKTDRFSEENFVKFVRQVLTSNPDALPVEEDNPWKKIANS
ncbi:SinI family restriction endonuclease [Synechococcus sp. B60.1]|uniref:SinI family restriction endonuclease n=1 Tax=Synechococcus sp. B60.1 TaxID=2964522 RepID=UPI0039C4C5E1